MKKVITVLGMAALFASCNQQGVDKNANLVTTLDSASYSFGMLVGSDVRKNSTADTLNQDLIFSGLAAGLDGDSTATIDRTDAMRIWRSFLEEQNKKQMEVAKEKMAQTKEEGVKFLADNKAKSGVITTDSGLQYQIIEQGDGKVPQKGDVAKVHYTGTLIDGTQFDTSLKGENKPFEFVIGEGRVIPGWDEALQLMPVGSKYKLFIPSDLAYGDREIPGIKGGSTLIFDVELLEIVDKK